MITKKKDSIYCPQDLVNRINAYIGDKGIHTYRELIIDLLDSIPTSAELSKIAELEAELVALKAQIKDITINNSSMNIGETIGENVGEGMGETVGEKRCELSVIHGVKKELEELKKFKSAVLEITEIERMNTGEAFKLIFEDENYKGMDTLDYLQLVVDFCKRDPTEEFPLQEAAEIVYNKSKSTANE